jgi:hypothetical protein
MGRCSIRSLAYPKFVNKEDFVSFEECAVLPDDFYLAESSFLTSCKAKTFSGIYFSQDICHDFNTHEGDFSLTAFYAPYTLTLLEKLSICWQDVPSNEIYVPSDDKWNQNSMRMMTSILGIKKFLVSSLLNCQVTKLGLVALKQNLVLGIINAYIDIYLSYLNLLKEKYNIYAYIPVKYISILEIYFQVISYMIYGMHQTSNAEVVLERLSVISYLSVENFACFPIDSRSLIMKDSEFGFSIDVGKLPVAPLFKKQFIRKSLFETLLESLFQSKFQSNSDLEELIVKELELEFLKGNSIANNSNLVFSQNADVYFTMMSARDWIVKFVEYLFSLKETQVPFFVFWKSIMSFYEMKYGVNMKNGLKNRLESRLFNFIRVRKIVWMPTITEKGMFFGRKTELGGVKAMVLQRGNIRNVISAKDRLISILKDKACLAVNQALIASCKNTPLWQNESIREFCSCPAFLIWKLELLLLAFLESGCFPCVSNSRFRPQYNLFLSYAICAFFDLEHFKVQKATRIQIDKLKQTMREYRIITNGNCLEYTDAYESSILEKVNKDDSSLTHMREYLRIPWSEDSNLKLDDFWTVISLREV